VKFGRGHSKVAPGGASSSYDQMSGLEKLMGSGVVYYGMPLLGGGAGLVGLVLGAIAAFIIERQFMQAGIYALAGAVLSFFGFIHGAQLGIGASPLAALGYFFLADICLIVVWS